MLRYHLGFDLWWVEEPLNEARRRHAVATAEGKPLVMGGENQVGFLSSAELLLDVSTPNGSACGRDSECPSGFCVDGVCCNEECNGTCDACSIAAKGQGDDGICGKDRGCRDICNSSVDCAFGEICSPARLCEAPKAVAGEAGCTSASRTQGAGAGAATALLGA